MTHTMKLRPASFEKIKEGRKIVELRLFDEKRRQIQLGDRIEFQKDAESVEKVVTEVIGLLHYPSFADLLQDIPLDYLGHTDRQVALDGVHSIYMAEDEARNGVLGIKIKLVEK